jgi:hypothetical protein
LSDQDRNKALSLLNKKFIQQQEPELKEQVKHLNKYIKKKFKKIKII